MRTYGRYVASTPDWWEIWCATCATADPRWSPSLRSLDRCLSAHIAHRYYAKQRPVAGLAWARKSRSITPPLPFPSTDVHHNGGALVLVHCTSIILPAHVLDSQLVSAVNLTHDGSARASTHAAASAQHETAQPRGWKNDLRSNFVTSQFSASRRRMSHGLDVNAAAFRSAYPADEDVRTSASPLRRTTFSVRPSEALYEASGVERGIAQSASAEAQGFAALVGDWVCAYHRCAMCLARWVGEPAPYRTRFAGERAGGQAEAQAGSALGTSRTSEASRPGRATLPRVYVVQLSRGSLPARRQIVRSILLLPGFFEALRRASGSENQGY